MSRRPSLSEPIRRGWQAARTNFRPGAVILLVALAILLGYYHWEPMHRALEVVRGWKERFGFGFSAVSTALFAGLLPLLFRLLAPATRRDPQWRHLPFFLALWAYKGVEVDALYRFQAWLFGDTPAPGAVAAKVVVDQFIYVPLWAVPTMLFGYAWKDAGYSLRRACARLGRGWFPRHAVPLLLANWAVWIPAVAIIYQLPLPLQLPLQNLILCLFVLMVMILTRADAENG